MLEWVYAVTRQCFDSKAELFSLAASVLSVSGWLAAGAHQIHTNYKAKDASGFSFYFLLCWLLGDLNNIAGCFLTHQMAFQKVLSLISLCVDFTLLSQYVYYTRQQTASAAAGTGPFHVYNQHDTDGRDDMSTKSLLSPSTSATAATYYVLAASAKAADAASLGIGVTALGVQPSYAQIIGRVCSWACQFCYCSAMVPQIFHNWWRHSTAGVSITLFLADMIGNIGYALSIVTAASALVGSERASFLRLELPYLLGTTLTIVFEIVLFMQYAHYPSHETVIVLEGLAPCDD